LPRVGEVSRCHTKVSMASRPVSQRRGSRQFRDNRIVGRAAEEAPAKLVISVPAPRAQAVINVVSRSSVFASGRAAGW
jgi:hypothetical protein